MKTMIAVLASTFLISTAFAVSQWLPLPVREMPNAI
jgi:hypothetical protein